MNKINAYKAVLTKTRNDQPRSMAKTLTPWLFKKGYVGETLFIINSTLL